MDPNDTEPSRDPCDIAQNLKQAIREISEQGSCLLMPGDLEWLREMLSIVSI